MSLQSSNYFCQFGGHNSTVKRELNYAASITCPFPEIDNLFSLWLVCQECDSVLKGLGDATMFVLSRWGKEYNTIDRVPYSLSINPIRQAQLVNHIDSLLNNKFRKKLGNRFPTFLTTPNASEKKYYLDALEQETLIRFLLPEIEDAPQRVSIGLRLWAGATVAAKATRPMHNVHGGQQNYTPEQRKADFQAADTYAQDDRVCMLGVQLAPVLELLVRSYENISLEGANPNSEIRKYLKVKDKNVISKEDIEIRVDSSMV
jgi:hypothetical protein